MGRKTTFRFIYGQSHSSPVHHHPNWGPSALCSTSNTQCAERPNPASVCETSIIPGRFLKCIPRSKATKTWRASRLDRYHAERYANRVVPVEGCAVHAASPGITPELLLGGGDIARTCNTSLMYPLS